MGACTVGRNGQIFIGVCQFSGPVCPGHDGGQTLGDAVVVVIAEYIQLHGGSRQQLLCGADVG